MTPQERLEAQVMALQARNHARKIQAEQEAQEMALAASRSCVSPEIEAETAENLAGAFLATLTQGVTPASMAEQKARAWETWITEEMERNRVPKRYRYEITDWGCDPQARVYRALTQLLTGVGATVAAIGLRGTGKTTLVLQLVIRRILEDYQRVFIEQQRGAAARWMPYRKMADLIARFKPLYADFGSVNSDELIAARESLCRADLLIIDELHECDDQKMKDRMLPDIIDRRYAQMKDTVLIANQSPEEFDATTSDSILSRIEEHGMIIPCQWGSFRAKDSGLPKPRHAEH